MHISIDIGYGYTKAVSDTGHRLSFPRWLPPHMDLFNAVFNNSTGHKVKIFTPDEEQ